MGILGKQPPREYQSIADETFHAFLHYVKTTAADYGMSVEAVIDARRVLELSRANDIAVADGDYWDENLGGIGEILSEIAQALKT